jgi:hypothetical protein
VTTLWFFPNCVGLMSAGAHGISAAVGQTGIAGAVTRIYRSGRDDEDVIGHTVLAERGRVAGGPPVLK